MLNKSPCIDCITYAICKTQIIDRVISSLNNLEDYDKPRIRDTSNEIMFAYYNILFRKCQILHSYIRTETKRIKDLEQFELDTPIICVILDYTFNIQRALDIYTIKKE